MKPTSTTNPDAPWQKTPLIIFFVLQTICTLPLIGLFLWMGSIGSNYPDNRNQVGSIVLGVFHIFALIALGITIILFAKHRLHVNTMLFLQIDLNIYWTACGVFELLWLFGVVGGAFHTVIDLAFTLANMIFFWGSGIYTIIVWRRCRRQAREPAYNLSGYENNTAPPTYIHDRGNGGGPAAAAAPAHGGDDRDGFAADGRQGQAKPLGFQFTERVRDDDGDALA